MEEWSPNNLLYGGRTRDDYYEVFREESRTQGNQGSMRISLLHVSDLHRDPHSPISNQTLLDSLERDRDQYLADDELGIDAPDLIIVSGDIVFGVKYGSPDAEAALRRQYEEALEFLEGLTQRFVNGNKRSVIIVPGNHDVSDHHFRESLGRIEIPTGGAKEIIGSLLSGKSDLRWCWDDLALYKISDLQRYSERFHPFVSFYEDFYGVDHSYSINGGSQFETFDFPGLGITVTGFSSCYNNDLLNRPGAIHPDSIAGASAELGKPDYDGRLRMAAWHHHIEGPPQEVGYMDPDIVQNLVYRGYSLGFHGHQHKPQYLDFRFRYGSARKITLISAGTLCGGAAYGFKRSYNLVQLDTDNRCGKLHVREMQNDNLLMPIWGQHSSPSNPTGSLDFDFDPPPAPQRRHRQHTSLLLRAQGLFEQGDFQQASEILFSVLDKDELARPLLLECLLQLKDYERVISAFYPPRGSAEAIAVMDSLWEEGRRDQLARLLTCSVIAESADPSVREIRARYTARLMR